MNLVQGMDSSKLLKMTTIQIVQTWISTERLAVDFLKSPWSLSSEDIGTCLMHSEARGSSHHVQGWPEPTQQVTLQMRSNKLATLWVCIDCYI